MDWKNIALTGQLCLSNDIKLHTAKSMDELTVRFAGVYIMMLYTKHEYNNSTTDEDDCVVVLLISDLGTLNIFARVLASSLPRFFYHLEDFLGMR